MARFGHDRVRFCADGPELLAATRRYPARCIVLDIAGLSNGSIPAIIRRLRPISHEAPIVGVCTLSSHAADEIVQAVRAGLHGLVICGFDNVPAEVTRVVSARQSLHVLRPALACLPETHSSAVRAFLRYATVNATRAPSVAQIAVALGIPHRTLVRRFASAHLPTPHEVAAWARVLIAVALLERGRPIGEVTRGVGCRSSRDLRRLLHRYLSRPPSKLRCLGSTTYAVALFQAIVARADLPRAACEQGRSEQTTFYPVRLL